MSGSSRILAVVDTNLVVSSIISKRGPPFQLVQALYADRFRIAMSPEVRAEYEDVLARPFLMRFGDIAKDDVAAFFRFLDRRSLEVSPLAEDQLPLVVRDSNDTHLLSAAFGGNANYVVSGDNDLLALAGDPRLGQLQIVDARNFLAILDRR